MIYVIEKLFTENEAFNIIEKHKKDCTNSYNIESYNEHANYALEKYLIEKKGYNEHDAKIKVKNEKGRQSKVKFLKDNVQFSKYKKGDHLDWHRDHPFFDEQKNDYSIIILLNDDFEGGEFEIENTKPLNLKTGDCVMLPSKMYHRVKPIIEGVRYSLTIFN